MRLLLYLLLLICVDTALAQRASAPGVAASSTRGLACTLAKQSAMSAGLTLIIPDITDHENFSDPADLDGCECDSVGSKVLCNAKTKGTRNLPSANLPSKKPTLARNVVLNGLVVSCNTAITYRNTELAAAMELAFKPPDKNADKRRQDALNKFDNDLKELTKDAGKAGDERDRKIKVAAVGMAIGLTATLWGGEAAGPGASEGQKRMVEALVGRGAEWTTFFGNLAFKEPDVKLADVKLDAADVIPLAAMPITLLIPFGGVGLAVGNGAIEFTTAIAEAELKISDTQNMGAEIRKRMHALVAKQKLPTIARLNVIKDEIDKSCAGVAN